MKNKIIFFLIFLFYSFPSLSENLFIEAKNISLNKKNKTTVFIDEVSVRTEDGVRITSNYAEYDKEKAYLVWEKI